MQHTAGLEVCVRQRIVLGISLYVALKHCTVESILPIILYRGTHFLYLLIKIFFK